MSDELLRPAAAGWLRARSGAARLIEVSGAPPTVVFDSLARLHACFRAGRANLMGVPGQLS